MSSATLSLLHELSTLLRDTTAYKHVFQKVNNELLIHRKSFKRQSHRYLPAARRIVMTSEREARTKTEPFRGELRQPALVLEFKLSLPFPCLAEMSTHNSKAWQYFDDISSPVSHLSGRTTSGSPQSASIFTARLPGKTITVPLGRR